eukprot:7453581-Pyramimonas_sp.AAC.1
MSAQCERNADALLTHCHRNPNAMPMRCQTFAKPMPMWRWRDSCLSTEFTKNLFVDDLESAP